MVSKTSQPDKSETRYARKKSVPRRRSCSGRRKRRVRAASEMPVRAKGVAHPQPGAEAPCAKLHGRVECVTLDDVEVVPTRSRVAGQWHCIGKVVERVTHQIGSEKLETSLGGATIRVSTLHYRFSARNTGHYRGGNVRLGGDAPT